MNELNETCLYLGQVRRASPLLHLTCICCHLGARENSKDRAGDEVGYKWDGGWDGSVARGDDWWTERRREQWHREASPQHESYGLQHVSVHQGWLLIDNYSELRYLLEHYDQRFEKANLASGTTSRHEKFENTHYVGEVHKSAALFCFYVTVTDWHYLSHNFALLFTLSFYSLIIYLFSIFFFTDFVIKKRGYPPVIRAFEATWSR